MKNSYFLNGRCYTPKGKRVAIFGKQDGQKLHIFELTCSENDNFSYSLARGIYENWETGEVENKYHPRIHSIDIEGDDTAQFTFSKYCNENFWKRKFYAFEVNLPIGRGNFVPLQQSGYIFYKHEKHAIEQQEA